MLRCTSYPIACLLRNAAGNTVRVDRKTYKEDSEGDQCAGLERYGAAEHGTLEINSL